MKRLIIISLVLAVVLLFVNWSFAGWNEGGFKNSPLFKHSLNEAVTNMENQGKQVASEGENMDTSSPKCNSPNAPLTSEGQPTCHETCVPTQCAGECYTQGITCYPTVCGGTCYETCSSTCSGPTCWSTCPATCENTCSCPPMLEGYCLYYGDRWDWTYWGNREVRIYDEGGHKLESADFNWDGWYEIESRLYQPLIEKDHASTPSGGKWLHVVGEQGFIQYQKEGYLDLDLNDEYKNNKPEWD